MATPRYVAKRIGNDYTFVRADPEGVVLSGLAAVGGGVLILQGLRGGFFNKLLAVAGGASLYYGLTGKNPVTAVQQMFEACPQTQERGPSFKHDGEFEAGQRPEDDIDEASMESFPASDPPAHSRSTASV